MDWGLGYATASLCRHWGTELGNPESFGMQILSIVAQISTLWT